jgi:cytidylate kinase
MKVKAAPRGAIITMDGPAGAGKSTVSKRLAEQLGYLYLDTGAMYRAVAVQVREKGLDPNDEIALENLCRGLEISFEQHGEKQRVICQGQDVTAKIRDPEVGWLASVVSTKRPVREAMVNLQRKIGEQGGIVAEGRDTGTVVFPGAPFKFYLDAQPIERVRRRHEELLAKGVQVTVAEVRREVEKRDRQDSSRELAPLHPAPGAHIIDSTGMEVGEIIKRMLAIIRGNNRE